MGAWTRYWGSASPVRVLYPFFANSTGGVMGKMIDAQSIVVSSVATRQEGNEAAIFKAVFWHSLVLASLVGLLVMFYAYVVPQVIP